MLNDLTCPCCGYVVINDECDICQICGWQYDSYQRENPDDSNGPNRVSLRQAQQNYIRHGRADDPPTVSVRMPLDEEQRDSDWRPL